MEWNMDIVKAEFVVSNATVEKCPKPDRHEYAFIGRSNVGKSSLINMLTNNKKLAKTAARPGLHGKGVAHLLPIFQLDTWQQLGL